MTPDNELQQLWRSEPAPSYLKLLMGRVRRHRLWWFARRTLEAAATIFIAGHYLIHRGSEVGHWLFFPIVLVFFPALWLLVYKNYAIARSHVGLNLQTCLQIRVQQLHAARREVRFMLISAAILLGYAASSWWVIRIVQAGEDAHQAAKDLLLLGTAVSMVIALLSFWRARYYRNELDVCQRALGELQER
jgi:uncharacterized membrane protein